MFIKSVVALAVAAVAVAQNTTNYIQFTNPVSPGITYTAGENTTFSWINPCVAPYTRVSATPTKTEVQLLDSTNPNSAFFVATVGYIDCSGTNGVTQGNPYWVVPAAQADATKTYALSIVVSPVTYSGTFKILPAGGSTGASPSTTASAAPAKATGAAASVAAPILSGAAALASAAYMLL
ncbi:hypothetical protein EMPS_08198 [Entomortierella parvispora]|uniref:Uncharacterized protein n=1 Tax=Entomortierella parvispora TaxID=205924 RepID=A0A9P3HFK5_9FUNG|nr:hypothetical protein EMPS_08198 [Entomortierella parvispora]